jgi:hypothetical protein
VIGLVAAFVYLPIANVMTGVISWLLGKGYVPHLQEALNDVSEQVQETRKRGAQNPNASGQSPYIYGAKGGGANPIFQENSEWNDR